MTCARVNFPFLLDSLTCDWAQSAVQFLSGCQMSFRFISVTAVCSSLTVFPTLQHALLLSHASSNLDDFMNCVDFWISVPKLLNHLKYKPVFILRFVVNGDSGLVERDAVLFYQRYPTFRKICWLRFEGQAVQKHHHFLTAWPYRRGQWYVSKRRKPFSELHCVT